MSRLIPSRLRSRRYLDKEGLPRPLEFEGRGSEFATLVGSVSKELNAYAVLFDLERLGLVERQEGKLHLLSTIHLSTADLKGALELVGRDIADLTGAVESNIFDGMEIPNLHLKVHYDNISRDDLDALKQWILDEGSQFAFKVQRHLATFDKDLNPALSKKPGGARLVLGVFSRAEDGGPPLHNQSSSWGRSPSPALTEPDL